MLRPPCPPRRSHGAARSRAIPAVLLAATLAWTSGSVAGPIEATGVALAGTDATRVELLGELPLRSYRNLGYRLSVNSTGTERRFAHVNVELTPLESSASFKLPPLRNTEPDRFEVLARAVTAGSGTHYQAVSRILAWVSRHVRYELDRSQPQTAEAVLARRSGYCTGIARVTVALLQAVGVEAREVPGIVVVPTPADSYFHRWVEIYYPQRGWAFSDPLSSHHHVPATYVPLANEQVSTAILVDDAAGPSVAVPVSLVWRDDRRQEIDIYHAAAPGVAARRNSDLQHAAALLVSVAEAADATVLLVGGGLRRQLQLQHGRGTFVGLAPGRYRLEVHDRYDQPIVRELSLPGIVRHALYLSSSPATRGAATRGR